MNHEDDKWYVQKLNEIDRRSQKKVGLDNPIRIQGFMEFSDYYTKLKMMNSPMFLLGLKLFNSSMEFYDADFCHVLQVYSQAFVNKEFVECCDLINSTLTSNNYSFFGFLS